MLKIEKKIGMRNPQRTEWVLRALGIFNFNSLKVTF
jgi:hypothetical protein